LRKSPDLKILLIGRCSSWPTIVIGVEGLCSQGIATGKNDVKMMHILFA
jgi:hypothetical protein